MSGNISHREQKLICIKSGNRCAIETCRKELVINKTNDGPYSIIAEIAHINGEKPTSARYDSNMTDIERNCYENLILVCGNCHKMIDDQPNAYTVEKLHQIKDSHERWILESTKNEIINISFAELEIITKYLSTSSYILNDSYTVIPPKDKIKKNGLSQNIEKLVIMGMTQVNQVSDFINKYPDIEFGERLRHGFVIEYENLKNNNGLDRDDLFHGLLDFASGGNNDFKIKAAGLSVLVYLFEKCEVFEK